MKKKLYKSTLALAVAVASTGAFAGSFSVVGGKTMLADEVFGDGSENTLVDVPETTFLPLNSTALNLTDGQSVGDGDTWTIKYTLDSGVVFGEDLTNIDDWANANVTLVFDFSGYRETVAFGPNPTVTNFSIDVGGNDTAGSWVDECGATITVDAGGAIGDNTVSFLVEIEDDSDVAPADNPLLYNGEFLSCNIDTVETVRAGGFDVKELKAPLERGQNDAVKLGVETLHNGVDVDTAPAQEILDSQYGIYSTRPRLTDYSCGGDRAMISVFADEEAFTGFTGCVAANDFLTTSNTIDFGDYTISRTMFGGDEVKDEDGQDFTFNANDTITVVATTVTDWMGYSSLWLRPGLDQGCAGLSLPGDINGTFNPGKTEYTFDLTGESIADLESGFTFCGVAGAGVLSTTPNISLDMTVNYFDPRYTISEDSENYDAVLRNGCQVTLFNVPNPSSPDKAFVRLTNISEIGGGVIGTMWTQDGTPIDVATVLVDELPAHATAVVTSDMSVTGNTYPATVYLGDAMTTFDAQTSGRNRLILEGAFPACEAMGLIRTANGVLTNMTSTTYSGDSTSWGGNFFDQPANGTSNTQN